MSVDGLYVQNNLVWVDPKTGKLSGPAWKFLTQLVARIGGATGESTDDLATALAALTDTVAALSQGDMLMQTAGATDTLAGAETFAPMVGIDPLSEEMRWQT